MKGDELLHIIQEVGVVAMDDEYRISGWPDNGIPSFDALEDSYDVAQSSRDIAVRLQGVVELNVSISIDRFQDVPTHSIAIVIGFGFHHSDDIK